MESITVKVREMTCSGCVASVTRVLQGVKGVGKVEVSLEPGQAKVEFNPGLVQREQLCAAIESAGFDTAL